VSQISEITGRFVPGQSGNPGGRPRGLARAARELLGDDGQAIVEFWMTIMADDTASTRDRLEASRLLADRGWGKPPAHQLVIDSEFVPISRQQEDTAVKALEAAITRLSAAKRPTDRTSVGIAAGDVKADRLASGD
jgi:Family of unknown function (DUF5681)